jgi:hypothetical protein
MKNQVFFMNIACLPIESSFFSAFMLLGRKRGIWQRRLFEQRKKALAIRVCLCYIFIALLHD